MRFLSASPEGQILDAKRPLIVSACDVAGAHVIPAHHHPRGQLLFALSGTMRVHIGKSAWIISPRMAVWVPSDAPHQVETAASISYRSVFVSPGIAQSIPYRGPIRIDALTRELILEAATFGSHYSPSSAESRLIRVLHDRLLCARKAPLTIPLPRDARTRRICDALLAQPADNRNLETWGRLVGATPRTLARLFSRELGMSFSDWTRHMRLALAVDKLAQGKAVTTIAYDLGYASPSAFCAMFRRVLGTSPSQYLADTQP